MKNANYVALGRKVQFYRNKFNLTQEQLASDIGLSQKQISNIERAYSIPSLQTFVHICNSLKVPPNQLLMDSIMIEYPERFAEMVVLLENCSLEQIDDINKFILYTVNKI